MCWSHSQYFRKVAMAHRVKFFILQTGPGSVLPAEGCGNGDYGLWSQSAGLELWYNDNQ